MSSTAESKTAIEYVNSAYPTNGKGPTPQYTSADNKLFEGTDDWDVPERVKSHPYFVEIGRGTLIEALRELDTRMKQSGEGSLIHKGAINGLFGHNLEASHVALWDDNGKPQVSLRPGKYLNFSLVRKWKKIADITSPINFLGLTTAQVGQGEALVVLDPSSRVFIIRNGGFVTYGNTGKFKVLSIVDTLNLGDECRHYETGTRKVIGWKKDVKAEIDQGSFTVATFLNIPANNVAIIQQNEKLFSLKAGQHVITNPNTTFRGFYSLSERQSNLETQPSYTVEGVPVVLNMNLRYRVFDPLLLTINYDDALAALKNPAQSAVNSVVSRMSYQQFMRAKKLSGDHPDNDFVHWLQSFKEECQMELDHQATGYGIKVESFDVLDRKLIGNLGKDLEEQAEKVLRNQMQATQVALENQIRTEQERGKLQIAEVKAQETKTNADAEYYSTTKKADAEYYRQLKKAEAEAEASRLEYAQKAKNVIQIAEAKAKEIDNISTAWSKVPDGHAQAMQLESLQVDKRKALPANTIYFGGNKEGGDLENTIAHGYSWRTGKNLAN